MKGGRTAPRNPVRRVLPFAPGLIASMKGGRTAPRNRVGVLAASEYRPCFNEGGADCPPKLIPENQTLPHELLASMKGGRTAPRNRQAHLLDDYPSALQ